MQLPADPHLKAMVSSLYEGFAPIFNEWHSQQANTPSIDMLALPKTAEECLHNDLYILGKFMADRDSHGHRLELNLLAEVLALLQQNDKGMPYEYIVEMVDKEIGSAKPASVDVASPAGDAVPDLVMYRVINEWSDGSEARKTAAKAVVASLMDLINAFVIRDGNVSSKELAIFTLVEKKFSL